jgi:hypothetical protein
MDTPEYGDNNPYAKMVGAVTKPGPNFITPKVKGSKRSKAKKTQNLVNNAVFVSTVAMEPPVNKFEKLNASGGYLTQQRQLAGSSEEKRRRFELSLYT